MNEFEIFFTRLKNQGLARNQSDLARLLNVTPSAITDAKSKGTVPQTWLHLLSSTKGLSFSWLKSGEGHPYSQTIASYDPPDHLRLTHGRQGREDAAAEYGLEPEGNRLPMWGGGWSELRWSARQILAMGNPQGLSVHRVDREQAGLVVGDLVVVDMSQKTGPGILAVRGDTGPEFATDPGNREILGRVVWLCRQRVEALTGLPTAYERNLAATGRMIAELESKNWPPDRIVEVLKLAEQGWGRGIAESATLDRAAHDE